MDGDPNAKEDGGGAGYDNAPFCPALSNITAFRGLHGDSGVGTPGRGTQ